VTSRPAITEIQEKKASPVKWWAVVGAAVVGLILYDWIDWLASGDAHATPKGPSKMPGWMLTADRIQEGVVIGFFVAAIYFFIIKPWRREHRLTFDGMLIIAWTSMYMLQDPWENYTRITYSYNSGFFNLGCPQCHVPGWLSPGGHGAHQFAEPLLFIGLMYGGILFLGTVFCCGVMRRAKKRWPTLGTTGLIGIALGTMFLLDFVLEIPAMRMGGWVWWWAGPKSLTLFHGKFYQQPLFEAVFWGLTWGAAACVRYFKNDKGQSLAERGIERVGASSKQKNALRVLALVGALNVVMLVCYTLPYQFFGLHDRATPASICSKSYFTNLMAGPGTNEACPGPQIPISVGSQSARVAPNGTLYTPSQLPVQLPANK
jgi:hypothetical protein